MNSQTVDTRAIKNLVVNMRDSGMTYQAIAEQLDKGYGIKRTRQALNRMYKRAKETELTNNNGKLLACDIANIYCLVGSAQATVDELQHLGINVAYSNVLSIIKSEDRYIKSIEKSILDKVIAAISSEYSSDKIRELLSYKGVLISNKRLDSYIVEAYTIKISKLIESECSKIYKDTHSAWIAKEVGHRFNIRACNIGYFEADNTQG